MKRLVFTLLCLCTLSAVAFAEEDTLVGTIDKENNYYILKGYDSLTKMDKDAYLRFIEANCPEAWASYQKGNKMWKAGWGLLGAGLAVEFLAGVPMVCHGLNKCTDTTDPQYILYVYGGAMIIGLGSAMEVGSIPLLVIGGIKRNNSHEVYNTSCRNANTVSLNLQANTNGLGLALKF